MADGGQAWGEGPGRGWVSALTQLLLFSCFSFKLEAAKGQP